MFRKWRSIASGSWPTRMFFNWSLIRERAIGPDDPASPYPIKPASVSTLMRQLPAMFFTCIALIAVIFTLPRCAWAKA